MRHLPLLGLALVAIVIGLGVFLRPAPPDGLLRWEVVGDQAVGFGFTDGRVQGSVDRLLDEHPDVRVLVLRDMPGTQDLLSNTRLARRIRANGLQTHVPADGRIASGAVDLFLAGRTRTVACGARIGVHAWGVAGYDAQDVGYDNFRSYQRAFLDDMGIDPDFYDFASQAARSSGIYWLDATEAWERGLLTEDPGCA